MKGEHMVFRPSHVCFLALDYLWGEDFVKIAGKTVCSSVVLFQAICKYCVVWHTSSTWKAWPLGLIVRAGYSPGEPRLVATGKRFALGMNGKGRRAAFLTLCGLAVPQPLLLGHRTETLPKAWALLGAFSRNRICGSPRASWRKRVPGVQVLLCRYQST